MKRWNMILSIVALLLIAANIVIWYPLRESELNIPEEVAYIEEVYETKWWRETVRIDDPALVAELCRVYRNLYLKQIPPELSANEIPNLHAGGREIRFFDASGALVYCFCYDSSLLTDQDGTVYYASCGADMGYYPLTLFQQRVVEDYGCEHTRAAPTE